MNGKLSTKTWLEIIAMIAAAILAFSAIRAKSSLNAASISINCDSIKKLADVQKEDHDAVISMVADVKHIKEDVKKIEEKL